MYIFYQAGIVFVTHECVNFVVLLPFPHLPLPLPVPIFSAQFAYFRQRKTKGDIAQPQKKTAKRKGSSVHTHDVPQEEHALVAQGCDSPDVGNGIGNQAEDTSLLETTAETEVNVSISCVSLHSTCR